VPETARRVFESDSQACGSTARLWTLEPDRLSWNRHRRSSEGVNPTLNKESRALERVSVFPTRLTAL